MGGNIVAAFRRFHEAGTIEILTCAATHGYMPLLGTDESVRAQLATAVETHIRHIGEAPRGIWVPECGYRPAGLWSFPVRASDGSELPPPSERIGVEQALNEAGLKYFFVDTHMIEESERVRFALHQRRKRCRATNPSPRSLYRPWFCRGADRESGRQQRPPRPSCATRGTGPAGVVGRYRLPPPMACTATFIRSAGREGIATGRLRVRMSIWATRSLTTRTTRSARVQAHASHFVHLAYEALKNGSDDGALPILCAPFDAELFGHWWFEGPLWLEAVARTLHEHPCGIELTCCGTYLKDHAPTGFVSMHEGSWGSEGRQPGVDEPGDRLDVQPPVSGRSVRARHLHGGQVV